MKEETKNSGGHFTTGGGGLQPQLHVGTNGPKKKRSNGLNCPIDSHLLLLLLRQSSPSSSVGEEEGTDFFPLQVPFYTWTFFISLMAAVERNL